MGVSGSIGRELAVEALRREGGNPSDLVASAREAAALREAVDVLEARALAEIAGAMAVTVERIAAVVERLERMQPAEWMNAKQAAAYLGKTPDALEKLVAAGEIPRHRLGERGYLYNRAEIDESIMER